MLNSVNVMGRLVANPEVKVIDKRKNRSVCNIRIAVADNYDRERTHFFDVVLWNATGEFVEKFFSKGDMIAITGRLSLNEFEDKEHNRRQKVEIIAEQVNFCGSTNKK